MQIRSFDNINGYHEATGYHGRTDTDEFHIFTIEDTYPTTRTVMTPYRLNFFQIVLFESSRDANLSINAQSLDDLDNTLFFASPDHVLAWVRGPAQRGFIVFFRSEFPVVRDRPIQDVFPFFRVGEVNALHLGASDRPSTRDHFVRLLHMFASNHPYRGVIMQAYLSALLFDCKRLYDANERVLYRTGPQQAMLYRFRHLIDQHFLTRKRVKEYADLLAVSSDYLGRVVRAHTGATALSLIEDRVAVEAKHLLRYSPLAVAEIADYLGYDEPTHFGRFFRRKIGISPSVWRRKPQ